MVPVAFHLFPDTNALGTRILKRAEQTPGPVCVRHFAPSFQGPHSLLGSGAFRGDGLVRYMRGDGAPPFCSGWAHEDPIAIPVGIGTHKNRTIIIGRTIKVAGTDSATYREFDSSSSVADPQNSPFISYQPIGPSSLRRSRIAALESLIVPKACPTSNVPGGRSPSKSIDLRFFTVAYKDTCRVHIRNA